jgi:hypothetical protein
VTTAARSCVRDRPRLPNYNPRPKNIRTAIFRGAVPALSKLIRRWGGRIVRHRADRPCASDSRRSEDSIVPRSIIQRFRVDLLVLPLLRSDGGEDRFGLPSELFTRRGVAVADGYQWSPHDGCEGSITAPKACGPDDLEVVADGRRAVERLRESVRALQAVAPCLPGPASASTVPSAHDVLVGDEGGAAAGIGSFVRSGLPHGSGI